MNNHKLNGLKVAILVADGFEEVELTEPRKALNEAGAQTFLISPVKDKVKSFKSKQWGEEFPVDKPLNQVNAGDFDALLLPGGVINPDTLRTFPEAISFIKEFVQENKPIAAICHGPWTLINADAVEGKKLTSWPSIQIDLMNAGANWVDKEVVVDENLVTSRKPDDLPAFNEAMIVLFSQSLQATI